jgi:c-di-GMP-binding flagellar brake protein YcgR
MSESSGADRREFFRINDTVYVEYSVISDDEAEKIGQLLRDPLHSDQGSEKDQLHTIQAAFNHLTDQINQTDRDIARALRLLDDKLNIINHLVQRQQNPTENNIPVDANLSGGGIAFLAPENLIPKSTLELKIQLPAKGNVVHTIANVIGCSRVDHAPQDTPYFLRLAFTHMSELDRNVLVKHILNRQAEDIRNNVHNLK